ncbi:hypothetical protein ACTXT7_007408 [Hymenolepis weldensis]
MVENQLEDDRPAHTNVFTGLELLRNNAFPIGPIALDCEMVGVDSNKRSALGRVSIVDYAGRILYDVISSPDKPITDFRTPYSGIRSKDMANALPFYKVRFDVKKLIEDRLVVGHGIKNDFQVLQITHPPELVRDTSTSPLVLKLANRSGKGPVALRYLALELLGREIQTSEHDSVIDARATIEIYRLVEDEWEALTGLKNVPVTDEPAFKTQPSETDSKNGCFKNCCSFC